MEGIISSIKVSVGSAGRFHTFDLARQLNKYNYLKKLYTACPRFKVDGIPLDKVRTFPWFMGASFILNRLGISFLKEYLNYFVVESFDNWVASHLEDCDIYHCLSSFGIKSHHRAKEHFNALTICDRGSSHILYQDEILAEEFARWGIPYKKIDRRIIDREIQEYEYCDLIFVPSSFAYRSFVKKGVSESKLFKIPYGVDLNLFHPVPKEDNVFRIIYVGALSLRKGIPDLLEAVCTLRLPKYEVWLIGGIMPEVISFMKKHEGHYRHLGIIPRNELYRYYSQGSVFSMASLEDGFGLVQAQAMACGLPVIATTNTGAEDLFTDGVEGFITPIRNPNAIKEKVLFLYEHPEIREQMAVSALKRVKSLGGWDTYGANIINAYKIALNKRGKNIAHSSL